MSDKIQNPYKLQPVPLKELCFDASEQAVKDFKFRFAKHGSIDGVLSSLFFHFMSSAIEQVPLAVTEEIEADNIAKFQQMITRLKFPF